MQMVALRETPTRQWTRVAVPFRRPRSGGGVSVLKIGGGREKYTDKLQTPLKLVRQRVDAIVLHALHDARILLAPLLQLAVAPHGHLAHAQDLPDAQRPQQVWVVGVPQVAQVHVVEDAAWEGAVEAGEPARLVAHECCDVGQAGARQRRRLVQ